MSRRVVIDYQGMTIDAQAQCDTAIHSLCKIDETISKVRVNASKLYDEEMRYFYSYLLDAKEKIANKINAFKKSLDEYKKLGLVEGMEESDRVQKYMKVQSEVEKNKSELIKTANELTGSKLELLNELLAKKLIEYGNRYMKALNGAVEIDIKDLEKLNEIEDFNLRALLAEVMRDPKSLDLTFEEKLEIAKKEYEELLNDTNEKAIDNYKEQLKSKGIDENIIKDVKDVDEANAIVNKARTDETIRKETLKVIVKAIKSRGFIVDTKHNLKLDKEKNVVRLVALKANGQKAEFEISLDGKFMYHFENYEGHACKKDIEPFLEDLHNIYDINILHEEITWENPDKIQTQKYQYVNKNKGTN